MASHLVGHQSEIGTHANYYECSWCLPQIPQGQLQRDRKVIDLIGTMERLYSYVCLVDNWAQFPFFEDTVHQILNQTIECAFFIRAYTQRSFGGKQIKIFSHKRFVDPALFLERALLQPLSAIPDKISEFQRAFVRLEQCLSTAHSIHIAFISSRTLDMVEGLRQSLIPCSEKY